MVLLSVWCLSAFGISDAVGAPADDSTDRVGTAIVQVGWDKSRQVVTLTETRKYTVSAHSKALAALRSGRGPVFCCDLLHRMNEDFYVQPLVRFADSPPPKIIQSSPDKPARIETQTVLRLTRLEGRQLLTLAVRRDELGSEVMAGDPTVWMVKVVARQWNIAQATGGVYSQSDHIVAWRIDTSAQVPKSGSAEDSVSLYRTLELTVPAERHQSRSEIVAAFAVAVGGGGVLAGLLILRLVGHAVPRRWAMIAGALIAITCVSATPETLPFETSEVILRYSPLAFFEGPDLIWVPGAALGYWLWYVLPVSGWWFSRRIVTGRPPSWKVLLACGVPPAVSAVLFAADGYTPAAAQVGLLFLSAAISVLVVVLLSRGPHGSAARRWAATAGTLLWICLALLFGTAPLLQRVEEDLSPIGMYTVVALLVTTWPAAAWLTSLLSPVLRRAFNWATKGACFALLWCALVSPFVSTGPRWGIFQFKDWLSPPYQGLFFTGYTGFPIFVMVMSGLALQVLYLYRRTDGSRLSRGAEPVARLLLLGGVIMCLGNPSLRTLSMWGASLAVLWVALTSLVLIPVGSDKATARLRRVSRKAHAHFMDRWVRSQVIWDSRAQFQRSSRSSLAEDMTLSDFTERWRELQVPGRQGDPATRLAGAKRFALGSAAGVDPRAAGLKGAVLAQGLALPWAVYKLVTGETVGADINMPFFLDGFAVALRFVHWSLYGFVFGYFYTLLRGTTPVAKAALLSGVVAPAEVLPMFTVTIDPQYTQAPSWADVVVACGGVAGQAFVVCMGLGLAWEWGLARAAGLKWSQVRNFRRLSSISVPVGTILVAAATAFATTIAGTWAQQELVPPSQPTASNSSTEGP
ncbi:hypothetical protein [Streptomyces sp. NPDC058614]|uniref:hypothetical protein n=1 Tax=Streptomyces sp. NPDC058614 TaxID=3346557 RepID=UPI00365A9393